MEMKLDCLEVVFAYDDFLNYLLLNLYTDSKLFEFLNQFFAINQINRPCTITLCLCPRFTGEAAGCNQQTFIRSSIHCSTEVANDRCPDASFVALGLELNVERQESTDSDNAFAVDSTIA